MLRLFIFVIFFYSSLFSQDSISSNKNLIDSTHQNITSTVKKVSNALDDGALWIFNFLSQKDKKDKTVQKDLEVLNPKSVDELFQNEKYIEGTNKSYLRLSGEYRNNLKGNSNLDIRLNAKVDLRKSNENLKLFISDFSQDNIDDIAHKKNANTNDAATIGVSYVESITKNLETKYSVGIRSLDPYVRARIAYKTEIKDWRVEPVQNFKYSVDDEFEEDTRVYIDKDLIKNVLFRLEFGRGTKTIEDGMRYDSAMHLFWTPQAKTGLQLTGAAYGNTKYKYTNAGSSEKTYNGVSNYLTQITLRQNIYRKWLFYSLTPSVNFEKSNNFKENYNVLLRIDMFFGKI